MSLLFVDTNIPIYATGKPHPLKAPSAEVLRLIAQRPHAFVTDAEVFQELVHRYLSLGFWPDPGLVVVETFELLMRGRIEPVGVADVLAAAHLVSSFPRLSARDLLHVSVARRVGAQAMVTANRDFDSLPGMERLDPGDIARWRERAMTS